MRAARRCTDYRFQIPDPIKLASGRPRILLRLFLEFFRIALFVVGGGYAILVVADDVFGRKLKWLREGELLEHLPIFQMIPGLIAGNNAIYVGMKVAGRTGAAVALLAVALPSLIIFLLVACGYDWLPLGNEWLESAFLGLRSSLFGVIAGTVISSWRKNVRGVYGYIALAAGVVAISVFHVNTFHVLLAAALAGITLEYCGLGGQAIGSDSAGVPLAPLPRRNRVALAVCVVAALATVTIIHGRLFWLFVKFGLMCFGGGFVLIPAYMDEFVGPDAAMLNLPTEEFSNLMALTQMTPGPVSVNSATFFGYRLAGVVGAVVATAGLLAPSYFLLTTALTSLDKWRTSRIVTGLMRGVRPATAALMVSASIVFGSMSVIRNTPDGHAFSPLGLALAALSAYALLSRRLSVMASIFLCALIALACHGVVACF